MNPHDFHHRNQNPIRLPIPSLGNMVFEFAPRLRINTNPTDNTNQPDICTVNTLTTCLPTDSLFSLRESIKPREWWESSESNADWQCHKLLCYRYTTFPMHPRLSEASFAKPISAVRCLRGSGASNLPTTNNSFSPAIRLMSDASLWAELLITRHPITSPLPNRTAR